MSPTHKSMTPGQRKRRATMRPDVRTGVKAKPALPRLETDEALHLRLDRAWRECRRLAETLADRVHSAAKPREGKGYFYLGLALLAAFAIQEIGHLRWPWLSSLQGDDVYKQLSGFGLLAFIAHQWHFSVLRNRGLMRQAAGLIKRHKRLGALAPLFFYLHSQPLGYAYLQVLSLAYFGVFLTGLLNFEVVRVRRPWFQPLWITAHVGLSTMLLLLLGYHVFISYAYR